MHRSRRLALVVTGVVAAAAGVIVLAVSAFGGCTPPDDQVRLAAAFRSDSAYRFVPSGATPVSEKSRFAICRGDLTNVPREDRPPPFTVAITMTYRIDEPPTPREMFALFQQPAAAAGWSLVDYSDPDQPAGQVTFCKMILGEVSELSMSPWGATDGTYRLNVSIFTPLDTPASPFQKPTDCPEPIPMR